MRSDRDWRNKTYAIVGLGLLGGSLGLLLKKKFRVHRVIGISRQRSKISYAKKIGAIDSGDIRPEILRYADFIILCTPVSAIPEWIRRAARFGKKGAIVTDVGSTKRAIVSAASRIRNVRFVGAHPMAGSHESGIEWARPDLYEGSLTFVTTTSRIEASALKEVTKFWGKVSKKVVVLAPEKHDRIVAEISHLPHALASLLVAGVSPAHFRFAGPGFLDTTRIAQGDAKIWRDIFLTNSDHLSAGLKKLSASISRLRRILQKKDGSALLSTLQKASSLRRRNTF